MSSTTTVRAGMRAAHVELSDVEELSDAQRAARRDGRPWGVYGRISKRKQGDGKGASLGIGRQLDDSTEYVQRLNPSASVEKYDDNMSAWDPDVVRDDFEQLIDDLAEGRLAGAVAWHADRYTRQPEQLERMFKAAKRGGAQLHTVIGGHIESKLTIRILSAVAAEESDQKSRRITRKHKELAMTGKPHGGRRRFGYEPGMQELRADEAAIVRDLVARLLNGESLASLARWLNDKKVPTTSGGKWTGPNLGTMLKRPMLAGFRVHNGEVVARAEWPAIIDETTHRSVTQKLNNPARKTTTGNATRHLLSGLGRCAECGGVLRGRPGRYDKTRRVYQCESTRHVHRDAEVVDKAVELLIVERLEQSDVHGALVDDSAEDESRALQTERDELDSKLDSLMTKYLAGKLDEAEWERAKRIAKDRLTELDVLLDDAATRARAPQVLKGMTGPGAAKAWADAPLARRRALIRYMCTVQLVGTRKTRRAFDEERDLLVDWN